MIVQTLNTFMLGATSVCLVLNIFRKKLFMLKEINLDQYNAVSQMLDSN